MHEGDDVVATYMWMGIYFGRWAVCRPARVTQANGAVSWMSFQLGHKLVDAAGRLGNFKFATIDRHHAAAVVAAILQSAEAFDKEIDGLMRADISDDAAHDV